MRTNQLSVHVATTTRKVGDKVYHSHLLRHSFREEGKVRNVTIANLSMLPLEAIEALRSALKGEKLLPAGGLLETTESRPHGHVAAVVGTMRKLGMDRLLAARSSRERDLAFSLIAGRLLAPGSKLSLATSFLAESRASSLAQVCGVEGADENELYAAMDWLLARQDKIEDALAKQYLCNGCLVLYDVSSSYFEGKTCPLAQFGYSRDKRGDRRQITYGLLCNADGCPVAVQVFDGRTNDHRTFPDQIRKIKERFKLERVILVGDRGMISEANMEKELEPSGLDWITALKAASIRTLVKAKVIEPSLFDTTNLVEVSHPDFPGERLIACFNPFTKERNLRRREELLQVTEKALEKVRERTQRKRDPLRGKGEIGIEAGKALARTGMGKYFRLVLTEDGIEWGRRVGVLLDEAALDGIYVIRTKVPPTQMDGAQTRDAYRALSKVERAFRCLKDLDLQIRPIHHRLEDRVRAHVFLCMLAYHVEWHLRAAWESLLYTENPPKAHSGKRATGRNAEGLPVMSFRGILAELKGLPRLVQRLKDSSAPSFISYPDTSPFQRKVLDLLGLTPAV